MYNLQKLKFSIKDFSSKCDQIHSFLHLVTGEALNGNLNFLFSDTRYKYKPIVQMKVT